MAGDGVSITQTLAQMGSVAKTQAKAQQPTQQTTPFSEQLQKQDDLKVQRVQETKQTEHDKIDPDQDRKDRRQRRKFKRKNKHLARGGDDPSPAHDEEAADLEEENKEELGALIDLRA